jgi:beta-fructofuranosidase
MHEQIIMNIIYKQILIFILFIGTVFNVNGQNKHTIDSKRDLIRVGNPVVLYEIPYLNDHTVIYNPADKKWHAYGIITGEKHFIHLTADFLTQTPWERHEDFCVDSCNREIWAPHIVYHDNIYYMFYTMTGEPREIRYATSTDLFEWKHPASNPLLAGNKNKDPMVFRNKNQWIMYYSMMKDQQHWVVGYSVSNDLIEWSKPEICFDENTESPGVESPFVVQRGEYYYLFLSARPWPQGGEDVFRSKTPYRWKPDDFIERIEPWHAAEIVRDLDGKWYLTLSSGKESKDFRIAPIYWNDGIESDSVSEIKNIK